MQRTQFVDLSTQQNKVLVDPSVVHVTELTEYKPENPQPGALRRGYCGVYYGGDGIAPVYRSEWFHMDEDQQWRDAIKYDDLVAMAAGREPRANAQLITSPIVPRKLKRKDGSFIMKDGKPMLQTDLTFVCLGMENPAKAAYSGYGARLRGLSDREFGEVQRQTTNPLLADAILPPSGADLSGVVQDTEPKEMVTELE